MIINCSNSQQISLLSADTVRLNQEKDIQVSSLPKLSSDVHYLLQQCGGLTQPVPDFTYPIQNRVKNLADSVQKLNTAKDSETKIKVSSLLRIAFYVALNATAVFAVITGAVVAPLAIAGVLGTTILSNTILSYYNADRINVDYAANYTTPLVPLFVGPFMPIYEILFKISDLQDIVETQGKKVGDHLFKVSSFLRENHAQINTIFSNRINEIQTSIRDLNEVEIDPRIQNIMKFEFNCKKANLQLNLNRYLTALNELNSAHSFYV